jgi:hypothetical protein
MKARGEPQPLRWCFDNVANRDHAKKKKKMERRKLRERKAIMVVCLVRFASYGRSLG